MIRNVRFFFSAAILTIATVGQIVLCLLLYKKNGDSVIRNIGWVILWISALFGWLPVFAFRKWGNIPRGRSYMHTQTLVDRGVYAIVRHPQYLAGILMGIGLTFIAQHWIVAIFGVVVVMTCLDTSEEERNCSQKFGKAYEQYKKKVPRLNFILGIMRLLFKRNRT